MRRSVAIIAYLALTSAAVAAGLGSKDATTPKARALAASGSFSFENSRDGEPIFGPAKPTTVYAGALAPMPPQPVGRLAPGESRSYEFVATLPAGPPETATQNDVQGASASVGYSWTAREATAAEPEPTPAARAPAAPPGGAPAGPGPLRLSITRVSQRLRHGRLLVWARCNRPCRISARGRLRARGAQAAKLRPPRQSRLTGRVQRLAIRVPGRYRRALTASKPRVQISARVVLRARAGDGQTDTARRRVVLRGRRSR